MSGPGRDARRDDQRSSRSGPASGSAFTRRLARGALALYPAAWRQRYGDEVRALLDESGTDLRTAASLAGQAALAWAWPLPHLYDRPARMRASVSTVLVAWTMLAGLGLVFAQLTMFQGARPPQHPIVGLCYAIFTVAAVVSALAVACGGLPLWLLMMRAALRRRSWRSAACLLSPAVVPAVYFGALKVVVTLLHRPHGVGQWWFIAFMLAGFVAACGFAAGPAAALRSLRPRGPAVDLAARAACVAATAISLAGAASIVAAVGATLWAPQYGGYHDGRPLAVYCPLVLLAAAAAIVSAARGLRACRQPG